MAMTGLAIAAALALAKDQLIDKPADKRKRTLAAETERNSPWTGQHAQPLNDSNTANTLLQYGATGASLGQGYENSQAANRLRDAETARLNTGGNIGGWYGGGRDFTAGSLGGEDYAKALGNESKSFSSAMSPYSKAQVPGSGYDSLYANDVNPDAQFFKGSPWYTK